MTIVPRSVYPKVQRPKVSLTKLNERQMRTIQIMGAAEAAVGAQAVVEEEKDGAEALDEAEESATLLKPMWNFLSGNNLHQKYKP